MTFVHIQKQQKRQPDGTVIDIFLVPAISIQSGSGGRKLIPNPAGQEACHFDTLKEAAEAVQRAGFDYMFEGQKTYTVGQSDKPKPIAFHGVESSVPLQEAVPILIERLKDREAAVVANAAFALGELGATSAVDALASILGNEESTVRQRAAEALAKLGKDSLTVLHQTLLEARQSKEKNAAHIRTAVMASYQELAHYHPHLLELVLPIAVSCLKDDSWLVRAQAALVVARAAELMKLSDSLE